MLSVRVALVGVTSLVGRICHCLTREYARLGGALSTPPTWTRYATAATADVADSPDCGGSRTDSGSPTRGGPPHAYLPSPGRLRRGEPERGPPRRTRNGGTSRYDAPRSSSNRASTPASSGRYSRATTSSCGPHCAPTLTLSWTGCGAPARSRAKSPRTPTSCAATSATP